MKKLLVSLTLLAVLIVPLSAMACGCQGNQYRTSTGPVSPEEAQQISINYLSTIDEQLQVGDIIMNDGNYLVNVKDRDGKQIAKLSIDKLTGDVRTIF